ncbi:MAG TPA: TPM domain-containing protein [Planctomycetota bacterium]|nr:TPM domain-containing protein [Planctomycetota bacterium]
MGAALALAICLAVGQPSVDVQVPDNQGWVTDLADLLPAAQEQQLELLMESYKQGSSHEIALLTVPDLGGETIERFALEVARAWAIGGAETSNGALLVVAQAERKLRIEVGRGLEGDLPDALAGRIIRDVITPAFQRGDMAGGIHQGIVAMHAAIGGDYGPLQRSARGRRQGGGLGGLILVAIVVFVVLASRRRGGGSGASSALPWWILLGSMNAGGRGGGGGFGGMGGGGGFTGFGGGGGFSGGGASGGW